MTANDEVEAGLIAELEVELDANEVIVLTKQQRADIAKTANECELKLKEVKGLVQDTLWTNFVYAELSTALQAAETECERAAAMRPDGNQEAYDFILGHLKQLAKSAKEVHGHWKRWVPPDEQEELQDRLKGLELYIPKLISRKADFIRLKVKEDTEEQVMIYLPMTMPTPAIKLKPMALPKFGWKKEWEGLQKQGEPTGSKEVKKFQLLDSLDNKITRDLRLNTYTAGDIFRVLENRYGHQTAIAIEIVEELQKIPPVRNHQPWKIVELIQAVEKALHDLSDLGNTGAIKNPVVAKSVESKLPGSLKKESLVYAADKGNTVTPENRFDSLLDFLKKQENIYEQLEQLRGDEPSRRETKTESRHTRTKSDHIGCVVCGDGKHKKKLYFCKPFRGLKPAKKKIAVRKLGACKMCLEVHDDSSYCNPAYLCKNQDCKDERVPEHHYYLCPNAQMKKNEVGQKKGRFDPERDKGQRRYTEEQEELFNKLSPELAKQCRDVFSNTASRALDTVKDQPGLLEGSGLHELPVIMMLIEVTANAGQKIGTLIDLASDTNYITHKAAKRLHLRSEEITVFASRLKRYFELHSQIQVERWYHFLDSQTVLGAIQRESYGYQTFFANRIGEIQSSTKVQDWWWLPGTLNIADVITRGTNPQNLKEDSEWQNGPKFLSLPEDQWPIKSAKELAATAKDSINKLQKTAFVAALTRAKAKELELNQNQNQVQTERRRPPAGSVIQNVVDIKHFSHLSRLIKTVAWIWRAAKRLEKIQP